MTLWTEAVDVRVPIIQAPVGNICSPALVATVCEAGALGMYSAAWRTPSELRSLIRATRDLTSRPFGVNLTLQWPEAQHELLTVAMEEGIRVYSLWWGDVRPFIRRLEGTGAVTLVTVSGADDARRAQDYGADAVVAQGYEAGGHVRGEVSTMPLIASVVDAVSIPVVAAGGIADARGIAAALCLGASGVWMGTRFVATKESAAHPVYKQAIIDSSETGTVHGTVFDHGWPDAPHRTLHNHTVDLALAGELDADDVLGTTEDGQPVRRFSEDEPLEGWSGDIDQMCLYAGQSCGLIHDIPSAGELVTSLWAGAQRELSRASALHTAFSGSGHTLAP